MRGTEGGLELTDRFECFLKVQHWVAAGDVGSRGVHGTALFDDLLPRRATTFVGKHVGRLAPVFRERAVIATPVTLAGDEQDEFAALLALNAPFGLAFLGWKNFGCHR